MKLHEQIMRATTIDDLEDILAGQVDAQNHMKATLEAEEPYTKLLGQLAERVSLWGMTHPPLDDMVDLISSIIMRATCLEFPEISAEDMVTHACYTQTFLQEIADKRKKVRALHATFLVNNKPNMKETH